MTRTALRGVFAHTYRQKTIEARPSLVAAMWSALAEHGFRVYATACFSMRCSERGHR
jgi:hypothetical protein